MINASFPLFAFLLQTSCVVVVELSPFKLSSALVFHSRGASLST